MKSLQQMIDLLAANGLNVEVSGSVGNFGLEISGNGFFKGWYELSQAMVDAHIENTAIDFGIL